MKLLEKERPRTTAYLNEAVALPVGARSRFADYVELTKPRVALLVLFTVAAGALLACQSVIDIATLMHTLVGTALVAAGASALNQLLERHSDALMQRTENRPLPAGRILPVEALLFGLVLGLTGLAYLAIFVRQPMTVAIAGLTFALYFFVYTPLKRLTTLNTLVGAVPGALPPLIGWTAMGGELGPQAAVLFFILFLWQVPHFLAIAWIYREDYGRAGLRMLSVVDDAGTMTGRQMVAYCLALVPVSLCWGLASPGSTLFVAAALLLGLAFVWTTIRFLCRPSIGQARSVLHLSLIYLPALLTLLLMERMLITTNY
jgi:protoheme IX farnesyltransferase